MITWEPSVVEILQMPCGILTATIMSIEMSFVTQSMKIHIPNTRDLPESAIGVIAIFRILGIKIAKKL